MKKSSILILFICICFHAGVSQNSWQIVNTPVNDNFTSVFFIDNSKGWIVSQTGTILSTSDGGMVWTTASFPEYHFQAVHFSNTDHGCVVGYEQIAADSSVILLTNDGGITWQEIDHYKVHRFNDVFLLGQKAWAVGCRDDLNLNCCYYSNDGGLTWDLQSSILVSGAELFGISFRDENLGSTCGSDGAFFITNSGGTSGWAAGISMPILNLNDIFNFGLLNGCIVGDEGTVLYTINNWYQHIDQTSNTDENLNGVSGDPITNKLWAVGDNGTIIYSPNYILGWAMQDSPTTENLNDVYIINENEGWAVGNNGTVLHMHPGVSICESASVFEISVYPNPAGDQIVILPGTSIIIDQVNIISIAGAHIKSRKNPGQNIITIDIRDISSGIYLVQTISHKGIYVEKVYIK